MVKLFISTIVIFFAMLAGNASATVKPVNCANCDGGGAPPECNWAYASSGVTYNGMTCHVWAGSDGQWHFAWW